MPRRLSRAAGAHCATALRPLLALGVACALIACERVVAVDVASGPERLVVEARLEARPAHLGARQSFRLTTTAPYFRNAPAPPVPDATVSVSDDLGRTVRFRPDVTPGLYVADSLVAESGRTYTLRIGWRGDVYEATDQLSPVTDITALYFTPPAGKDPAVDGLRATVDLEDPPADRNFYLWDQWVDGQRLVVPDTAFLLRVVAADDFYGGRTVVGFQPYDGVRVRSGQTVRVRQYSLSETLWRYYAALNQQTSGDGSPFSVPAASVRGNVANLTRPSVRALGYFSASAVAERTAVVP